MALETLLCPVCGEAATSITHDEEQVGMEYRDDVKFDDDGSHGGYFPVMAICGEAKVRCANHIEPVRRKLWDAPQTNEYIAVHRPLS